MCSSYCRTVSAMKRVMKTENVSRRILVAGVGAVCAATALVYLPALLPGLFDDGAPAANGPAARATLAARTGAPAALPDLAALIDDREKWLAEHGDDDASWAVLGAAYAERGARLGDAASFPKAEQALRRSLRERSAAGGNLDAQLGLGLLANARGEWKSARTFAEQVRKANPKRWSTYPVLIDAYSGIGDYTSARKAMETLEKLRSGAMVSARAARVHRDHGWREDAWADAEHAAALAGTPPEKAAALARLGDLAWERGEPEEALAQYGTALRVVPGHGPALAGRARARAALGRTDEAAGDYRTVLEKSPLPEYVLAAGELHESMGLDGDARSLYERLRTEAWRNGADGQVVLGLYEADHGDPAAAVRRLQAEWARGHGSMQVADALGWALYRADRAREALPYAKRATEEGMRSALFAYHRGVIEQALEEYGPARRHLAEALRINPYFSPLLAPRAREAVAALGAPSDELPEELRPESEAGPAKTGTEKKAPARNPAAGSGAAGAARTGGTSSGDAEAPGAPETPGVPGTARAERSASREVPGEPRP